MTLACCQKRCFSARNWSDDHGGPRTSGRPDVWEYDIAVTRWSSAYEAKSQSPSAEVLHKWVICRSLCVIS